MSCVYLRSWEKRDNGISPKTEERKKNVTIEINEQQTKIQN